jgi:hypothetical protein
MGLGILYAQRLLNPALGIEGALAEINAKTAGGQSASVGAVNALVIATTPGSNPATPPTALLSVTGYSDLAAGQYIQIHDAVAAPADGAVPLFTFWVPGKSVFSLDVPVNVTNGIYLCNSTTFATKTIGAANCFFIARNV